jgi:hypothetical protein
MTYSVRRGATELRHSQEIHQLLGRTIWSDELDNETFLTPILRNYLTPFNARVQRSLEWLLRSILLYKGTEPLPRSVARCSFHVAMVVSANPLGVTQHFNALPFANSASHSQFLPSSILISSCAKRHGVLESGPSTEHSRGCSSK